MNLFSVCPASCCDFDPKPYDGKRAWGDFDRCPKCNEIMDVWTESGVRNERIRQGRGLSLSQAQSGGEA
jgi:hypothetical protein